MTTIVDQEPVPAGPDLPAVPPAGDSAAPDHRRRKRLLLFLLLLLLAALMLVAGWYLLFRKPISELPLPGVTSPAVPTYSFAFYGPTEPQGIAVTPAGDRIYVAESGADRALMVFDAKGNLLKQSTPPGTQASGRTPVYVAVNPVTSEVYVSDRPGKVIDIYAADGSYLRQFKPDATMKDWAPLGLAFDASGNLYVSDVAPDAQVVLKFDATGKLLQTIGKDSAMSYPNGISVDAAGRIVVADGSNGRLLVFDPAGNRLGIVSRGTADGQLGMPRGTAIDDHGSVVVVDTTAHAVNFYSLDQGTGSPTFLGTVGTEGRQEGGLEYPTGAAADAHGHVYVADTRNDRIQVWSY